MDTSFTSKRGEEGMALVLALIVLVSMALTLGFLADRTRTQMAQTESYIEFQDALLGAEAGYATALAELNGASGDEDLDKDGLVGLDPDYDLSGDKPTFETDGVKPWTMASMPGIDYFAFSYDWSVDGLDNNGDGTKDEVAEEDYYTIYAYARGGNSIRRIEAIVEGGNVNVWNNAVFAGSGQAGALINGNVSIHGSVHLLGDNLGNGDLAVAAIDLTGTSMIHNNYVGLAAGLAGMVPALKTVTHAGESVQSLDAKLRVKNGLVGLSGNSEVGEANVTGNAVKETMDGVYVSDGYTGNALNADGTPKQMYSDNGVLNGYDLGDAVPFPTFANDVGGDHLGNYLTNDAANVGLHFVKTGNVAITLNQNYYWNATTGTESVNQSLGAGTMPTSASLNANHYYIWFDAATNRLRVNGRVPIDGNLTINPGTGADKTLNYTGKATILAYDADSSGNGGDVTVEASMLTMNANGTTTNSFPQNNLLGLMAQDDMMLGISSQLNIMGGFYSQDQISLNKQSTIMGTIVGNIFNMGGQVPDIYQVPALQDAWTTNMKMIGATPVEFLSPLSWRELGVV